MAMIATGNEDEALDILQDAMFKLVDKYRHLSEDDWGPLFTRILQSRIRDWYRRYSVRNRILTWIGFSKDDESDDPMEFPDRHTPTPEQQNIHDQDIQNIEMMIHQLPLKQQQAFLLRTLEGLDVKETAAAMGCSTGSVKTHYSRAVHKLREHERGQS